MQDSFPQRPFSLSQTLFLLVCSVVFIIAIITRLSFLTTFPPGLDQDEAVNGYDAYTLLHTGRDHRGNVFPILLQSFEDWVPSLLTYTTVPSVALFGLSVWSVRLVVALYGVGGVALLYALCRQLSLSKWWSLGGATVLTLSGWHLYFSHYAIPPSIVPFFSFLFLIVLMKWFSLKDSQRSVQTLWWGVAMGGSASLLTHAYSTLNLHIPVLFTIIFVVTLVARRYLLKSFVIACITYAVVAGPMLWITITEPWKYNARFDEISILGQPGPWYQFTTQYWEYLSFDFLFGQGDRSAYRQMKGQPLFLPVLAVPFLLGIFTVLHHIHSGFVMIGKHQKVSTLSLTSLMLLCWLFLAPVSTALTNESYHLFRSIHLLPVVVILIILGLEKLHTALRKGSFPILAPASMLIIFGMLSIFFTLYIYTAVTTYPRKISRYFASEIEQILPLMLNDQSCKTRALTQQIQQPYIFYLFNTQKLPDEKLYQQLNQKTTVISYPNAVTPKQVDDVSILRITKEDVADSELIAKGTLPLPFAFYRSQHGDCVVMREY